MVYVNNKVGLLPAGQIKPGDILVVITSEQQASQAEVIWVHKVERKGMYAPVTVNGNIAVSGIATSSFIALSSAFQPHLSFEDQHWLQHVSYAFYNICRGLVGCDGETYDGGMVFQMPFCSGFLCSTGLRSTVKSCCQDWPFVSR